jgi:hypothetical protein
MIPLWLVKYGLGALVLGAVLFGIHHHGVVSGKAARDSFWEPKFLAAEKAAAEANAKTTAIESAQTAATTAAEAHHAEVLQDLSTRYADANSRIRALSLRLAAGNAGCGKVPAVPDSTAVPDGPTPSEERALRAADAIADTGRRCELDAAALDGLQQWIREQAALRH